MKYIRTKDGRIIDTSNIVLQDGLTINDIKDISEETGFPACYENEEIIKYADTIEELIQIGDIVFYWSSNDDKEHAHLIRCNMEIIIFRREVITKLLIPVREDYKCVAKGYPSFNLIKNKRYLVNRGELELL